MYGQTDNGQYTVFFWEPINATTLELRIDDFVPIFACLGIKLYGCVSSKGNAVRAFCRDLRTCFYHEVEVKILFSMYYIYSINCQLLHGQHQLSPVVYSSKTRVK